MTKLANTVKNWNRLWGRLFTLACMFICPLWIPHSHADNNKINQTKQQLHALAVKIEQLQHTLQRVYDKKSLLTHELTDTELHITTCNQALAKIARQMNAAQSAIDTLNQQITVLNERHRQEKLKQQQHLLVRYKLGQPDFMKWLIGLNQQSQRVFAYHAYIMQARKDSILQIHTIQLALNKHQQQRQQALLTQQRLKQNLAQQQLALNEHKQYQKALLQSMQHTIQTKQQRIESYTQNQAALTQLLAKLEQEQHKQPRFTFANIHWSKKFPLPVQIAKSQISPMNQGIMLFAGEGDAVTAVLPGKIVFTDWLKGYGYLLIIDHGHGLMTLYAHNRTLLKHKGDIVTQGEKIASVGHSGTIKKNGLYFEVRRQGKATSPLAWLA